MYKFIFIEVGKRILLLNEYKINNIDIKASNLIVCMKKDENFTIKFIDMGGSCLDH